MPSYVVTGASRGIGLEFVRQLSAIPENQVFALVRNKAAALDVPSSPLKNGPSNLHVLEADVTNDKALKIAAATVAKLTGGSLDVLINNAAAVHRDNNWRNLTDFEGEDELLEQDFNFIMKANVLGVIYCTNTFLPLLRKGPTKKVVTISSSGGNRELVYKTGLSAMAIYAISKAGVDMAITKFAAELKDEGFIFILLCPGMVDTSATTISKPSAKNLEWLSKTVEKITSSLEDAPALTSPEVSVKKQLKIIAQSSEKDNGAFFYAW